jgi:PAS domain S-box-containing protein
VKLKAKLAILLGAVITTGVTLSAFTVYMVAREQLERAARTRLEQAVGLIARQMDSRFAKLKSDTDLWAALPLVQQCAVHPDSERLVSETNRYFQRIVKQEKILQTINLHETTARCIASSIPSRIGLNVMQQTVATRTDFLSALKGHAASLGPFMALSTGRPVIAISAPVSVGGRVRGVLRSVVDMDFTNEVFLKPLTLGQAGRTFVFGPGLNTTVPPGARIYDVITDKQYESPDMPKLPEMVQRKSGFVEYKSRSALRYAAFRWTKEPRWLVVVELPLAEVLTPIRSLKQAASTVAVLLLLLVWLAAYLAAKPVLEDLRECMGLARALQSGELWSRIEIRSRDEIGELARGLNSMAASLAANQRALEESERRYREIFEQATEGIFQTTEDGRILAANPALADILGYRSADDLVGQSAVARWAEGSRRQTFLRALQARGRVTDFEFEFLRKDGTRRRGALHAVLANNTAANAKVIQGLLEDITDRRAAEAARERAARAERLLVESRLQTLRYQLNPHFLFNVINSIDALAHQAPHRIHELVRQLARYLRFSLEWREQSVVPLRLELESIESYLRVEQVRFEEDLETAIEAETDVQECEIPILLLQPLVENAIKYGRETSERPLRLRISAVKEQDELVLRVANTGRWVEPGSALSRKQTRLGLENLRQRLELLYPGRYAFEVATAEVPASDGSADWVTATIRLPAEGGAGHELTRGRARGESAPSPPASTSSSCTL